VTDPQVFGQRNGRRVSARRGFHWLKMRLKSFSKTSTMSRVGVQWEPTNRKLTTNLVPNLVQKFTFLESNRYYHYCATRKPTTDRSSLSNGVLFELYTKHEMVLGVCYVMYSYAANVFLPCSSRCNNANVWISIFDLHLTLTEIVRHNETII
jgi:hypothetical protein